MSFDWRETHLGDFIELKRGYDLPKSKRTPGNIPLVSSAGVSDLHNESKVSGPGVVTGRYGTIGEVFFVREDFWPLNTTLYVKDFKGNDPRFVYYFLKTIDYLKYSDKAAVPGVNRNHLHLADVKVPNSISLQRHIASILGNLDDKILLNQQINQTLEQMAQAIFKSWFVDFEPVKAKMAALEAGGSEEDALIAAMQAISGKDQGQLSHFKTEQPEQYNELRTTAELFPSAMQDSELGEIPEGWEWSTVGEQVSVVGGGTPSTKSPEFWEDGEIHWTTPKDLSNQQDKVLLNTSRRITLLGLNKISSGLLSKDTVLMSSRAPVGYLTLTKIPVAINQGYIAMKCNSLVTPEFMLQWCNANIAEIKGRASGTTFSEISKANFRLITMVMPLDSLIEQYTKRVRVIYDSIVACAQESKSLADVRDTLLPRLLSGTVKPNQDKCNLQNDI